MAKKDYDKETAQQIQKTEELLKGATKELSYSPVTAGRYNPQEHKDKTRSEIALYFVKGYFAIIIFVFAFTFVYNAVFQSQILDIIQVFTAVSGGLSGLLGFVLGYYFKSEEEK